MSELRNKNGLTEAEFLANYRPGNWPHPSVTADSVLLSQDAEGLWVMLIRRGNHPCMGMWALPGGFLEEEEPAYHAAIRELEEETHLTDIPTVLLGVFSDPHRDPRHWTITCAYAAVVDRTQVQGRAGDDAADCRWFGISHRWEGEKLHLSLTDGEETLTAALLAHRVRNPLGQEVRWELLENHGLAFDHAKVIAMAVDRLG